MGIFEEFKQNRADIIECILTVNYNKKALNSGLLTNDEQKAALRAISKNLTIARLTIKETWSLVDTKAAIKDVQDVLADPNVVRRFCLPGTNPAAICNSIRRLVAECMEV